MPRSGRLLRISIDRLIKASPNTSSAHGHATSSRNEADAHHKEHTWQLHYCQRASAKTALEERGWIGAGGNCRGDDGVDDDDDDDDDD
eukprot:4500857-Pyramimonas_sp.AAC.1